MSIIHDALKKVQQGQAPKPDTPPTSPGTANTPDPDYIYSNSPEKQAEDKPIEYLPSSKQNVAKSVLAFICALAITLGAFGFLYKQVCAYFPGFKNWAKISINKLMHKKTLPDFKTKSPEDLKPLAKITVNPAQPLVAPGSTAPSGQPANLPVAANGTETSMPLTLNIHGVMSNGPDNLVLINDQVYQEGDEIDGIKIVKIDLNSITIINNGKEETIPVKN